MIEHWTIKEVDRLVPLLRQWCEHTNGDANGVEIFFERGFSDLKQMLKTCPGTLIVSLEDDKPIGLLALFKLPNVLSDQEVGFEKYWYTGNRKCGVGLFHEAEKWCRQNGCSHLVMCASNLASGLHDKVCRFYGRMGMTLYETTFIKEIK